MFGLNQGEPPQAAPGPPAASSGGKALSLLVLLLLVISGINLYLAISARMKADDALAKHTDELNLLTRRLDSSDERYAQLSGQFRVKLGLSQQEIQRARALAAGIQKQQQDAVLELNEAIAKKASTDDVNKLQADSNAKISGLSGDLAGTKKDLEATKEALMGTKGELTGAIARTHDELVALAHRTDRDYFEFNLARKGAKQKIGTLMVELARTNPKKNQYSINLYFDDKRTERKDKSINEPLYFYMQGASSALEMVINKLGKDSITGYVSAPKGFIANAPNVITSRPGT
ncbi:MAG: hypothetical protein DMG23_15560 [Acidobacteria bacterium]|nr:MAG: hypothetical protein DMG23_15560 [Acidobacteriota bacterium]